MPFPQPFFRWRPHPWHGLEVGPEPPEMVTAYIEITPFDSVKYEVDKKTGYLMVDRPNRTSSQPPALYGFIPRTYCGPRVHALAPQSKCGDRDPLDICVLSERPIQKNEIILNARVVGGLQMIDGGEADDKMIAVLKNDHLWGNAKDIADLPEAIIERITHYFETYKLSPDRESEVSVDFIYGYKHAYKVVEAAMADYQETFGEG